MTVTALYKPDPLRKENAALLEPAPSSALHHVWYDTGGRDFGSLSTILGRVGNSRLDGVMLYPSNAEQIDAVVSPRLRRILYVGSRSELDALPARATKETQQPWIIASTKTDVLDAARAEGRPCCYRVHVNNANELDDAIQLGRRCAWLLMSLKDVTNIPLELAIATLQDSGTTLIKEIVDPNRIEDAIVALGVMEKGADGVMYSPTSHDLLDRFLEQIDHAQLTRMAVEVGVVQRTAPVGMGHRACVDLITLFGPKEGLLIGSTSRGGILCCPEVFPMPYMDLRPFRVNAGAIHSYIYGLDRKTNYLSELRAGSQAAVVGLDGLVRRSIVGRVKTEVRPLRLVEVEFAEGESVNVFLQDDWHVRIFSADGLPICLSDLKVGDKVLGHVASPGRHVGIKIRETIVER